VGGSRPCVGEGARVDARCAGVGVDRLEPYSRVRETIAGVRRVPRVVEIDSQYVEPASAILAREAGELRERGAARLADSAVGSMERR
jgi:hypothetical protein